MERMPTSPMVVEGVSIRKEMPSWIQPCFGVQRIVWNYQFKDALKPSLFSAIIIIMCTINHLKSAHELEDVITECLEQS